MLIRSQSSRLHFKFIVEVVAREPRVRDVHSNWTFRTKDFSHKSFSTSF